MPENEEQKKFEELLVKDFPLLYRDMRGDPKKTCMAWGVSVEKGWYKIIYTLSEKLENMIKALPVEEQENYAAAQIKEKFSQLRFYMTCQTTEMTKAIHEAEEKSSKTCEKCGEDGSTRKLPWILTLCDEHHKEELERLRNLGIKI